MQQVKVVSITDGKYYSDKFTSGSTVNVTLQRGDDFASCDGILIWEDELVDDEVFDEWVELAMAGEEGYGAMLVEGDSTVMY